MRYYGSFVVCIAASLFLSVGPLQLLTLGSARGLRLSLRAMMEELVDPQQQGLGTPSPAALSWWLAVALALEASVALG
jgi:hypothetical protein